MSQYDYLVVGAGLSGAVFANAAKRAGKSVLVIDRRDHIAGNVYTEDVEGIQVHRYGAHIFHTSMKDVWDYVNRFAEFNNYVNSPVANFHGNMYNMPFNMNTFAKMWPGVVTPADAKAKIAEQVAAENISEPAEHVGDHLGVAAHGDALIAVVEVVVVVGKAAGETLDDACGQILAVAAPLLFGVALHERLEDVAAYEGQGLLLEVRGLADVLGGHLLGDLGLGVRRRDDARPHLGEGVHVEGHVASRRS